MLPSRLLLGCRIGDNIRGTHRDHLTGTLQRISDNIRAGTRRDHLTGTLQRMEVKFTPEL